MNKELSFVSDLLNSLVGVLLQFQNQKTAFLETWKLCFTKSELSLRVALQFLWADSPFEDPTKTDTCHMLLHIFGATDSPYCANFAVKFVARDNKERCGRIASESILKSFYTN